MDRSVTRSMAVAGLVATLAWVGVAFAQTSQEERLPRGFQKARLGMAMEELLRLDPQTVSAKQLKGQTTDPSAVVTSKDPYVHHIEYRFYRGRLYEQAIYYKRDRLPRGYTGLVDRLREVYGRPASENLLDFDPTPDSLSSQKTVWKDKHTRIALAEFRKMREGREYYELVLTMTDLALEQGREQAEEALLREKEMRVPIPLPDGQRTPKQSAGLPASPARS